MIKRINFSALDRQFLALKSIETNPIKADLSNVIVNKPWGYEYLLSNTPLVEIWHLSLNHLKSTSTHCHPNKKTALIVLEGKALFSSLNESAELSPLDAVILDSGVFHSTQCLSKQGLKLLEIETPPMKHDLIRLKDNYGRAGKGYEGSKEMSSTDNTYIKFNGQDMIKKNLCNKKICFSFIETQKKLANQPFFKKPGLSVILSGFIKSNTGKSLYELGDVISTDELNKPKVKFQNVSLLSIYK